MDRQRIALLPGSFDPFTLGHLSVVERGSRLFDRIIVAVGVNSVKIPTQDVDDRISSIKEVVSRFSNVEVAAYDGLTVEACRKYGAEFILRGVRTISDYEYERNMADVNRDLAGIETVLLYSLPEHSSVSSSMVRELRRYGVDVSKYLPDLQNR